MIKKINIALFLVFAILLGIKLGCPEVIDWLWVFSPVLTAVGIKVLRMLNWLLFGK